MVLNGLPHHCAVRNRANQFSADVHVTSQLEKFLVGERSRFVEDVVGHENLADIVHAGGIDKVCRLVGGQTQCASDHLGIAGDHIAVAGAANLPRLGGAAQDFDRLFEQRHIAFLVDGA